MVEICKSYSKTLTRLRANMAPVAYVGERAVSVISEQVISNGLKLVRVTVGSPAGLIYTTEKGALFEAPLQVTAHEKVEVTVIVIVEKTCTGCPAFGLNSSF